MSLIRNCAGFGKEAGKSILRCINTVAYYLILDAKAKRLEYENTNMRIMMERYYGYPVSNHLSERLCQLKLELQTLRASRFFAFRKRLSVTLIRVTQRFGVSAGL
jgi:hypothetical protein